MGVGSMSSRDPHLSETAQGSGSLRRRLQADLGRLVSLVLIGTKLLCSNHGGVGGAYGLGWIDAVACWVGMGPPLVPGHSVRPQGLCFTLVGEP